MKCAYFDAHVCRSCTELETPYAEQLIAKQQRVADVLPPTRWLDPVASKESHFRNKAKMVVSTSSTTGSATIGILDPRGHGIDLRECGLHDERLFDALPVLADFIEEAGLTPYSVPDRRGELKHVIATVSPAGRLMVRWVLRSRDQLASVEQHLSALMKALPIDVASVNLQPEHKAILEGPEEIVLTDESSLSMQINNVVLSLQPRSFFQTNTEIAAALYREARAIVSEIGPSSVWDLYCGVGGFALHMQTPGREVVGVDTVTSAPWISADALDWARTQPAVPDVVIVNPPRRGIGEEFATWLESSGVEHVLYSSCNVDTLARDLAAMPSLKPQNARLLDMFPHTHHHEVLVHLQRA